MDTSNQYLGHLDRNNLQVSLGVVQMKMWKKAYWTYYTKLSTKDCIQLICNSPHSFGPNPFNPDYYDCELITDTTLRLVFKGAKFGRLLRTEYTASFQEDINGCLIGVQFQKELFGLFPMTSTYHLDLFFDEKVQAHRQ